MRAARARRVDANLSLIVAAYRRLGCAVHVTNGDWDATVQWGGVTDLVEVKDGDKPPSARKLTPNEEKLGRQMMIRMVLSVADVAEHVASLRRRQMRMMDA